MGERVDRALLADLDAGLLPPERAVRVRAAAQADPRSAAVLDALAATRAELAALGDPVLPAHLSARWTAALRDADPCTRGPVLDPVPAASRSGRAGTRPPHRAARRRVLSALVAAAAAAALVAGLVVRSDDRLPVTRIELAALARSTVGLDDLGELADPDRRAGCLAAVGEPGAPVVGGRRVSLDGDPGVLLVLTTGVLGRFRVLVVDAACGPAGGSLLAERIVGA